jgi:hypothetical protein
MVIESFNQNSVMNWQLPNPSEKTWEQEKEATQHKLKKLMDRIDRARESFDDRTPPS